MDRCAAGTFLISPIAAVRPYLNQSTKRKKWRFLPAARRNLCKIVDFGEKN